MDYPRRYHSETGIVDEMLAGTSEWRNIQDIVRLTFKALSDVVKAQGGKLTHIERELAGKIGRSEFATALNGKASAIDVQQTFSQIQASIENPNFERKSENVSRSDLQYLLGNRVSLDEVRGLVENSQRDWDSDWKNMEQKLRTLTEETEYIRSLLSEKANKRELTEGLTEGLEDKANKQTVANALHKKVNRTDLDALLVSKADLADLQKTAFSLENKAEKDCLDEIHRLLATKADKSSVPKRNESDDFKEQVSNELTELADQLRRVKSDLETTRKTLSASVSKKVEYKEIENLYSLVGKKAEYEPTMDIIDRIKYELTELRQDLKKSLQTDRQKSTASSDLRLKFETDLSQLHVRVQGLLEESHNSLEENQRYLKAAATSTRNEMLSGLAPFAEQLEKFSRDIDSLVQMKLDKADFFNVKLLTNSIKEKPSLVEVRELLKATANELSNQTTTLCDELQCRLTELHSQFNRSLGETLSKSVFERALSDKVTSSQLELVLKSVPSQTALDSCLSEFSSFTVQLGTKLSLKELHESVSPLKVQLSNLESQLQLKSNIKDICSLLEMKTNIEDTNTALKEIHSELANKLPIDDFTSHLTQQQGVLETLCAQNCVGRWIWKSGEVATAGAIPWELQSINTAPENFMWEHNKTSVVVVTPGLYELALGFYARQRPTAQVLVNGESVLTVGGGSKHRTAKHPSGIITGLTLFEFIALPARARVSVNYAGDPHGEGFLSLKKL